MTLDELIEKLTFIQDEVGGDGDVVLYDPYICESKHIDSITIGSLTGIVTIWAETEHE